MEGGKCLHSPRMPAMTGESSDSRVHSQKALLSQTRRRASDAAKDQQSLYLLVGWNLKEFLVAVNAGCNGGLEELVLECLTR